MLTKEQIDQIKIDFSLTQESSSEEKFLKIANDIAVNLDAKYAEIYIVDSNREFAIRRAGSGEIGKILNKHPPRRNLKEHNSLLSQVGPTIVSGKAKVVDWKLGEITEYELPPLLTNAFIEPRATVIPDLRRLFESPQLESRQDIYLPIRSKNNNVGALVIYFDDLVVTSGMEIFLLQKIADFVGDFLD